MRNPFRLRARLKDLEHMVCTDREAVHRSLITALSEHAPNYDPAITRDFGFAQVRLRKRTDTLESGTLILKLSDIRRSSLFSQSQSKYLGPREYKSRAFKAWATARF